MVCVYGDLGVCSLIRRGARIQKGGGVVQEFRLENRSYPDVHDFSLRMQVIIYILLIARLHLTCAK